MLAFVLVAPAPAHASGEKTWKAASNIGVYGLIAASVGIPLAKSDTNGAIQAAGSIAVAELVAVGGKEAFPEWRPDRSDKKSFPSGHTAAAFAAASSIFERQGQSVGLPAFAVATMVGVARVKADKHHWYDAVVGGVIGTAAGLLITRKPISDQVAIIPWGDTHSGGVSVAMRF